MKDMFMGNWGHRRLDRLLISMLKIIMFRGALFKSQDMGMLWFCLEGDT